MKHYKVIIADDEPLVRERIVHLINSFERFDVIKECSDGLQTIQAVEEQSPHVLFLDIKMPMASGFDILDRIKRKDMLIIFITAYDQFAVKAFEYAAFDYLLKPIAKERFNRSMKRAISTLTNYKDSGPVFIMIHSKGIRSKIEVNDITHIEADDNYVKIHTTTDILRKRSTMKKLMQELEEFGLVRVHRSFSINKRHIRDMVRIYQGDYLIRMIGGRVIPSSRLYREQVKLLYHK